MKRHTKTGIHTEKRRHLVSYMNQRIEGFQKIPAVLTDRACKISALSFLALLLGVHTGRQVGTPIICCAAAKSRSMRLWRAWSMN